MLGVGVAAGHHRQAAQWLGSGVLWEPEGLDGGGS